MNVLAALDIGTNAIRLEIVRIEPNHSITTLSQQKQTVRLGENEFATGRMTPGAIERGVLVCSRFADVARGFGADEIIAFATSAVREAENREEFIERVRNDAELEVRVISGPEEARLIYLGVMTGTDIRDKRALFIDIGGGSTELILGDAERYYQLDSMKLGAIRVSNKFLDGETGAISPERFNKLKEYVRGVASHTTREFASFGYDQIYGSAGTITNLADVTARRLGDQPTSLLNYKVRIEDLQDTVAHLCSLPLEERRKVPGLDPDRADIIIGGAAVLMSVLEGVRAQHIVVSDRGLRDGIIVDRLLAEASGRETFAVPVRMRSVLQLGRSCGFDEEHSRYVSRLALRIFDETHKLALHPYGPRERELLEYAALVHDIGCFLSHTNHQRHSYYLIRNSDLLGFTDTDIDIIANVAYYHRKGTPKKRHDNAKALTRPSRRLVAVLAGILRLAEVLDRSHLALVKDLQIERKHNPERLIMNIHSDSDCQLELWGLETGRELFESSLGIPLQSRIHQTSASPVSDAPTKARRKASKHT